MTTASVQPVPAMPYAELVTVTPDLAEAWLAKNHQNRNVRDHKVSTYAAAMESGDWLVTGDGPKFTTSGRLINGQHTLKAVALAGKPVQMFVFRNMHPDSQFVMDMGSKRSIADALKFAGISGCSLTILAATARIAIAWEEGHYKRSGQTRRTREVTSLEVIEWVYQNPDSIPAVAQGDLLRRSIAIPPSVLSFAHMTFTRIDPEAATRFFALAANFQTSGKGDPIYTMLRRYQGAVQAKEYMETPQHLFLLFRTWNAWRAGEKLLQLKIGTVGTGEGQVSAISIPKPH